MYKCIQKLEKCVRDGVHPGYTRATAFIIHFKVKMYQRGRSLVFTMLLVVDGIKVLPELPYRREIKENPVVREGVQPDQGMFAEPPPQLKGCSLDLILVERCR